MRPKLKPFSEGGVRAGYSFFCPGCARGHQFFAGWTFNGDMERPSFTPSLRVFTPAHVLVDATGKTTRVPEETLCHLYLTGGVLKFMDDSKHALRGREVALVDWPEGYQV